MKSFTDARVAIGGLKGVMAKLKDAPVDGRWNPMSACPFCGAKGTSGVFTKGGVDYFKCHQQKGRKHTGCVTNGDVLTEVSYIAMREGLSESQPTEGGASPAYRRFLELAGCWEEPPAPTPAPKPAARKPEAQKPLRPNPVKPEQPAPSPAPPVHAEDEELILKCVEIIRAENKAGINLFQRHLKIGYSRAARIMDELEKRGIVGPVNGQEPREILKLPEPSGMFVIKIGDELHIEKNGKEAEPNQPAREAAAKQDDKKEDDKNKLPPGFEALRYLYSRLNPTCNQMTAFLEAPISFCDKCWMPVPGSACKKCGETPRVHTSVPDLIPSAIAKKLKFKPVSMFAKRALTRVTCEALGLRANPSANESLLRELYERFSWEEIRASGLWLEASRKAKLGRRPDAQFHGKGQIGKKPERERRGKDDKWLWGFCEPVLIPYFDEAGDLIKLRPHKGGARSGTVAGRPRIYVPRDYRNCADVVEKFYEVIICEGEFKAMAIWQTLGMGAKLQWQADGLPAVLPANFEPIGVCALPGISYVTNVEMRMDLERWLADVGARRVIVAFDDEDKSDKPMRQRFDAQRDARVLAIELSKQLHLEARVCVLPQSWRNSRGKADWDGALVKITSEVTA